MLNLLSSKKFFLIKVICIISAITILLFKSSQHYSNFFYIILLLYIGYYLGKITCSVHLKNASLSITISIFILMNIIHSFADGVSFIGQSFFYCIGAVIGHELIRQPMLYIILLSILQPIIKSNYIKILICFISITITWLVGVYIGKVVGSSLVINSNIGLLSGYMIFLFIGDIIHHIIDQYYLIKK